MNLSFNGKGRLTQPKERRLAFPARGDVGVLDGRIDHAQRGELALVLGPHRVLDRIVDVVAQHRSHLSNSRGPDLGRSRP